MNTQTLTTHMQASHHALRKQLDVAAAARAAPDGEHPRAQRPPVDAFLVAASRHDAAVMTVLVPLVRTRLDDGQARAKALVSRCRTLELSLNMIKAKLYGSTYATRGPWHDLWVQARNDFDELCRTELACARDVDEHSWPSDPDWMPMLQRAESSAPTRPHPWLPHQGVPGRAARAVARRVDAFWDNTEGRMIPAPALHRDRPHEGRITQWLLADPHLPDDDD